MKTHPPLYPLLSIVKGGEFCVALFLNKNPTGYVRSELFIPAGPAYVRNGGIKTRQRAEPIPRESAEARKKVFCMAMKPGLKHCL